MMSGFSSKTFSLLFSFFWLIAANHCVLGDLLAENSSTGQKTQSHSGCHHDEQSGDKQSGNHHSKCQDKGCCGPAIIKGDSSHLALAKSVSFQPLLLPVSNFTYSVFTTHLETVAFHCLSPPGQDRLLISSLTQAPNAPPITLLS